jgi:L-fucose isomerase-like protein
MEMNRDRAKAGLALLSAQWFVEVGLQGEASERQKELGRMIEGDLRRIRTTLAPHFELIDPGPISSVATAEAAARRFQGEGVELVVLVHVMWSEDPPLVRLIEGLGELPLVLWCYNPYPRLPEHMSVEQLFRASGSVGFLQGSAPLSMRGKGFTYLFGSPESPELQARLAELSRVFSVRSALHRLRIGRIGPPCAYMAGTFVDELGLASRLGVAIVPLSVYRLSEEARALESALVHDFIEELKRRYRIDGVSDRALDRAARASLAVRALVEKENLGAVAIEDLHPELHELLGTRPCLWVPGLRERGVVVGMEADVLSVVGLWLSRNLGSSTPMYAEVFTYDQEANCLLLGHAAMHDPELAGNNEITIVPDREYEASDPVEGAWTHFTAKAGPVTLVSLFGRGDVYRVFCLRGVTLSSRVKLAGFAHALVRIDPSVAEFFEQAGRLGMMQHFALSYDDVSAALETLCRIEGMHFTLLAGDRPMAGHSRRG